MTTAEILDKAIDLLCGSSSGYTAGTDADCEWREQKDKLLKAYAARDRVAANPKGQ